MSVLTVLEERGFIDSVTHTQELRDYLDNNATCYIGFDPTASSLHVGNLICIMALAHMQLAGHRPIVLIGGGTGLIGDPSGKTELRKILTQEEIDKNKKSIRKQLERFINFENGQAIIQDNANWLTKLEYLSFLREIGRYFSVNRMLKADSCKSRMNSEDGLTFIEFNYMILQAYDFMVLARDYGCMLQMGGSDQWGNIVAGIDLIHKTLRKQAFGLTFPLLITASGIKMGKTHQGAVWLDPEALSPYDYYQFWVNVDDADVIRFLKLFTFLDLNEIEEVKTFVGAELNKLKVILAFETTRIAHGKKAATASLKASMSMFGRIDISDNILPGSIIHMGSHLVADDESVPTSEMVSREIVNQVNVLDLFVLTGLCGSKSDARRLIEQGGAYINGDKVSSFEQLVSSVDIVDSEILIRAGKKRYHKIILK